MATFCLFVVQKVSSSSRRREGEGQQGGRCLPEAPLISPDFTDFTKLHNMWLLLKDLLKVSETISCMCNLCIHCTHDYCPRWQSERVDYFQLDSHWPGSVEDIGVSKHWVQTAALRALSIWEVTGVSLFEAQVHANTEGNTQTCANCKHLLGWLQQLVETRLTNCSYS